MLEHINNIFDSLPTWLQYITAIVIFPALFLINRFIMDKKFRKEVLELLRVIKRKERIKLDNHIIFIYKGIAESYITNLDVGSKLKNDIFTMILETKISTVISLTNGYLTSYKKKKIHSNMSYEFSELINKMICTYEKKIKDSLKKTYKSDADNLYKLVYEPFEKHHSRNVSYILKMIESFDHSRLGDDDKVDMFFNMLHIALDAAVIDCERAFRSLNGSLREYEEKYSLSYGTKKRLFS